MRTAALQNLGCKVNAYETEAMEQMLLKAGYEIVPFNGHADVYIVNTCSVTNIADRKSRQMLHRAKKHNPNSVVVATGCYAQTATDKLREDLSIDLIIGNNKKKEIVDILQRYFDGEERQEYVIDINHTDEYEDMELATVTEHTRAHIKVQDGCNNFCSYCIIPYARGRVRSRSMASIAAEATELAKQGYKEVVISGINLSYYKDGEYTLIDVVEMLQGVEGLYRIRFGSLDPEIITEDFVKRLSKLSKVCPHFHLSLQSGCDNTLKAMNRRYTSGEYFDKCSLIREYFDDPAFTTDVIVGFPGESEQDYIASREFVKKVGFSGLHVFKYSRRHGTVADKMDNQINDQIKNVRSEELIAVGQSLEKEYKDRRLNTSCQVLFEEEIEINNKAYWVGHTPDYIKVAVESTENLEGSLQNVRIFDYLSHEIMLASL